MPSGGSNSSPLEPPTGRIKLEQDSSYSRRSGLALAMESNGVGEKRRSEEAVRAAATAVSVGVAVPFTSIRLLKERRRQRREAEQSTEEAEVEAAAAAAGRVGTGMEAEAEGLGRQTELDSAVEVLEHGQLAVSEAAVVLREALCSPRSPIPSVPSAAAASVPRSSVNFKRFHKPSSSFPSCSSSLPSSRASLPSSSVQLVVADSGQGCSAAAEVNAVRRAEHIERLTAQLDDAVSYGHSGLVPGKRKR